ncbi:MAG: peptidase M64 [Bacteroidetes bacterium 4572_112]|nr:MAG: peptidase M64 [Bacteroidetes bacterium 4572_112]
MKKLQILLFVLVSLNINAQNFEQLFDKGSLRIDYIHSATHDKEIISLDEYYHEPHWGGSEINLIDTFNYGYYKFEMHDSISDNLLYSRGFSTLSAEWTSTPEAKDNWRSFSESIIMPFPLKTVNVKIYKRNKQQNWEEIYVFLVNPKNYMINPDLKTKIKAFKIHDSGSPAEKLDLVILAEGYTESELQKFMKDAQRFTDTLLSWAPFDKYSKNINVWAVPTVSDESGTDIPGDGVYKNTYFDSHFYTFDTERYINTTKNVKIRDAAANAPYDQIYILVNTEKYGGAGIYNYYSICTADNPYSGFVFCHEFGHAFAGLADEYYSSDVSVENYYDLTKEPWEANITTLVDFDKKWKSDVDPKTKIPTEISKTNNPLGAYEGGGYVEKGIYRPLPDCSMKSIRSNDFCPVCNKAIVELLEFYSK